MNRAMRTFLANPYLAAVRNGLTLTLPIVMAGSFAVLLNNLPIVWYQETMVRFWGEQWRSFGGYIWNGTFAVMSFFMIYTISQSIGERHNVDHPMQQINPAIVALIAFSCLMTLIQPADEVFAIPYLWAGIHGLFLAIVVSLLASFIFLRLLHIPIFRISFYSEEADVSIPHAFNSLFPGLLTVLVFAALKACATAAGYPNIHQLVYDFLRNPFLKMGNTFLTSVIYNFVRHLFWFFGLHGSNILEPVTTELYISAMDANVAAFAAGAKPPFMFTKTFFDVFISMGGSGSTICMIIACLLYSRRGSFRKIAQLSLFPALFNINEMMIFGIPIVLNPIYLIPFIGTPLVLSMTTCLAMWSGLVPYTIQTVSWTTPILISGYAATNSYNGVVLQLVNIVIGVAIYLPFVKIGEREKSRQFEKAFVKLALLADGNIDASTAGAALVSRPDEAGALARSLVSDLESALEKKYQLYIEYQPQVNCYTGKVFGVEALIRWHHPHIGRVPPPVLIAIAEDVGLIKKIGLWTLDEACRQLKEWRAQGLLDLVMSVNLSVRQLEDPELPNHIMAVLEKYDLPPDHLEIEVTESVALAKETGFSKLLGEIHSRGVRLAIDDFGMGHSSLVYLKQFPVNTLKIDKVLSRDVLTKDGSAEIIMTIADLCRSLDVSMLVEYVETVEQLRKLKWLGAVSIQGYLFSRPLLPEACYNYICNGAKIYD